MASSFFRQRQAFVARRFLGHPVEIGLRRDAHALPGGSGVGIVQGPNRLLFRIDPAVRIAEPDDIVLEVLDGADGLRTDPAIYIQTLSRGSHQVVQPDLNSFHVELLVLAEPADGARDSNR
ncbi:hypothetical protein QW131_25890 [Roseibium salinum]|nr:hypothetical protein [Roseibium salinum]